MPWRQQFLFGLSLLLVWLSIGHELAHGQSRSTPVRTAYSALLADKGKKIGIARLGCASDLAVCAALEQFGQTWCLLT